MPNILGIKVDAISRPQALALVDQMIRHGGQHIITTPNPEMLVAAQKDQEFRLALNRAALALPDGIGLMFASWILNSKLQCRVPGSDFVMDLMELSANKGYAVYLLGGKQGIAQAAAEKLKIKYQKLKIVGVDSGPSFNNDSGGKKLGFDKTKPSFEDPRISLLQDNYIERINDARPDILLVAFGHNKQEKWIAQHLHELPSVKVAMGVGGVFDFISGGIKRAPIIFRKLGLEWFWRLILQPHRIKRIWNAVAIFSFLVLKEKISKYR